MRIHSTEDEEIYNELNIKDENIIFVYRDYNHQVMKIMFNELEIMEEFETYINKKFLNSISLVKKLEKESFEYSSIIDFIFALKMFVKSFSKQCEIKNVEYISIKINHKLHL